VRSRNIRYLPGVDHLRLLAAVLVVAYHGVTNFAPVAGRHDITPVALAHPGDPLTTLVVQGHTGVALFMVLSGFIFTHGTLGHRIDYGRFLRNRALRILPLLVLVLVVGWAVSPGHVSAGGLVRTLLGLQTGLHFGAWTVVTWTVFIELQFYLLFPLLSRLLAARGPLALLGVVALATAVRQAALGLGGSPSTLIYGSLLGRIDQFVVGMLVAWVMLRGADRRLALAGLPGVLAVYGLLTAYGRADTFVGHWWQAFWPSAEALAWGAVAVAYLTLAHDARGRLSRAAARLGETTYSVYLLHFVIGYGVWQAGWVVPVPGGVLGRALATALLVSLPLSLAVARLSYRVVELPFMRRRVRYLDVAAGRRSAASVPVAT
jgi:peptidoglycan/LPS O-acetylase OafA/YrhL